MLLAGITFFAHVLISQVKLRQKDIQSIHSLTQGWATLFGSRATLEDVAQAWSNRTFFAPYHSKLNILSALSREVYQI